MSLSLLAFSPVAEALLLDWDRVDAVRVLSFPDSVMRRPDAVSVNLSAIRSTATDLRLMEAPIMPSSRTLTRV